MFGLCGSHLNRLIIPRALRLYEMLLNKANNNMDTTSAYMESSLSRQNAIKLTRNHVKRRIGLSEEAREGLLYYSPTIFNNLTVTLASECE